MPIANKLIGTANITNTICTLSSLIQNDATLGIKKTKNGRAIQ